MSNDTAKTITTNIVPVQGTFEPLPPYECINLIGPAGTPFFAPVNPNLDGMSITNSTINSTTIGATTPATAQFTTASQQNQPVGNNDLTTKLYVDSLALGISWKQPVNAATTANITLSGAQTIDTVSIVAGDRVLVKDQTASAENGIYVAASGAWSRAPDADTFDEMVSALVFVESGGSAGAAFYCPIQPGGTLGTTAITWNNFSVGGVYFAGTGLDLSGGDTFNISNTTVTPASYGSGSAVATFTVNAQGQLTAASDTNIAIAATQITSGTLDAARLTGTYNIDISGNAATATSATTAGSASTATTATNLAGGASGNVPYQTGAGATSFLATGSDGQVLTLASGVPSWATPTTGTVTSVGGTGTVSGISLSGTVTSSGNLTLGGALDLSSPPAIGGTAPNTGAFTTVEATSFATNVAAAGVTLSGTSLNADGTDTNINMTITPKGSGGLGINGTPTGDIAGSTLTAKFCVKQDESGPVAAFVKANNSAATPGSTIFACRSRGTLASPTVVQNNDRLVTVLALGFDGTDLASAASIDFEVDGTPGTDDMPGRIIFSTTPDGSQTPTEAMRIGSNQTVTIGTAALTNATVSNDLNLTGTLSLNGSSGTAGYVLTSNGASDPTWEANANGVTIADDTTTNATRYITFSDLTTGTETTLDVSSTKLTFNPSTGIVTSTEFSGALNGTVGATTPASGSFTTLNTSGAVVFNDAGADVDFRVEGNTNANLFVVDASADSIGIGTNAPAVLAHVQDTTATTDAVTQVLRIDSQSSGTPANGIGVGMQFATETSAGNTEIGATIEAITTDVTATSEDFDLSFKTMAAGAAAAERARIKSTGDFQFNSGFGSVATAYGCRAWVNFAGATSNINGSGNVSSVTEVATGRYTVNFSTAMPDDDYCVQYIGSSTQTPNQVKSYMISENSVPTTTAVSVVARQSHNLTQATEPVLNFVSVFR